MNLKHLTDMALLEDTKNLAQNERQMSLHVLHHLKEIERRRLFSDLSYNSLFEYAVKELGYSDASASRRIQAARLLRDLPSIERKIANGELTLSNLVQAGQLFKHEGIRDKDIQREILATIENKTSRECGRTLLNFLTSPVPPKEMEIQTTLSITTVRFNLSHETMALLNEIKDILAHNRLSNDELLKRVFKVALEDFKKKKFKLNAKLTPTSPSPSIGRYISGITKKEVYRRDNGQCVKCKSTYKLEYDHITPFSHGGDSSAQNLRLLCFSCNQRRIK